jgi:D-sedoheptulose 7-phosphate isomerase
MAEALPEKRIEQVLRTHIDAAKRAKESLLNIPLADVFTKLLAVARNGGCIYSCGNGGSTCDSIHLTEELVARFKRTRPGIRAQHFCDAATITCWSNDFDYHGVFERCVETFVTETDALIVFSTSGNSQNILRALEAANKKSALTVALLGKTGGKAKEIAKHPLVVSGEESGPIQEAHMAFVHCFCEFLETTLYPDAK